MWLIDISICFFPEMLRNGSKLIKPLARAATAKPAARNIFSLRRSPWNQVSVVDQMMRDMDRQFERMERQFDNMLRDVGFFRPSLTAGNRLLQPSVESEVVAEGKPNKYTLNIDVGQHFDPENVKVSLKDRMLSIEAKGEYKSEDGSTRVYQEIRRQFTLPDNVDVKELKSVMSPDGILRIEAPLPEQPKLEPKEIPILKEGEQQEKIGQNWKINLISIHLMCNMNS